MPISFIIAVVATLAGIAGLAKGKEAISNNSQAKNFIDSAQFKYDKSKNLMEEQRQFTIDDLEMLGETKLKSWSNDIGRFFQAFKKFKNVDIEGKINVDEKLKNQIGRNGNFENMEVASLKVFEVIKAWVLTLGTVALAAIASYGCAMMFASESTGTFVLGGIVAGPVIAVIGLIMAAKSEENLASAKKIYSEANLAAEKMDTVKDFMKKVSDIANDYNDFITDFSQIYQPVLQKIDDMYSKSKKQQNTFSTNRARKSFVKSYKVDYIKLKIDDQKILQESWLMAQVLSAVLSAPLLTKEGNLDSDVYNTLIKSKETIKKLIGETC